MRRLLKTILVATGILLLASPAYAGIPIPCTGETIVKVLDLPQTSAAKSTGDRGTNEQHFDLGYKFNGCWGGEWVGYVGDTGRYLKIPEPLLKLLLLRTGHTELPPAPSFMGTPKASWVVWMYIVLFTPVLIAGIFGQKPASASESDITGTGDAATAIPARASAGPQTPLGPLDAVTRPNPRNSVSRGPNIQGRLAGAPGFGRRG